MTTVYYMYMYIVYSQIS